MNRRANHQEAKMPKVYIKCLHCGEIEATVSGRGGFCGDMELCLEKRETRIVPGVCANCQCRKLNTGRSLILKGELTQIALKDQMDD